MTKEINIFILILTIVTGMLNFFFLGLVLAFTSGSQELTINEIIAHICVWTSLIHVLLSSWLFIKLKVIGRVLAILTSLIGLIEPIMIMSDGISLLWMSISVCLSLIGLFHINNLIYENIIKIKIKKQPTKTVEFFETTLLINKRNERNIDN